MWPQMKGTTGLKGLKVDCVVGIYEHERNKSQTIFVDVELDYDFGPAARSDSIADAVDYDTVATSITELAQRRKFQLIETMAEEMAVTLLGRLSSVRTVRLEVRKPAAVPAAECSYVSIERSRS